MVVYMYIVPIHNGVSIATSKVQMPKTGQHNTKQYNGASDEMFVLHKMTSWVMVLMYFGLLLALIMQESYNIAQNPCNFTTCCSIPCCQVPCNTLISFVLGAEIAAIKFIEEHT